MLIILHPIRCEMKPQKITAKPQQRSVMTWYKTTSWPFLLREIVNFPFELSEKAFLPQTNTSHLILSIQKPNYQIDLKSELQIVNINNGTGSGHGKRFLSSKKIRIESHQSQPTSMTSWNARERNTEEHCLWLAHLSLLSDALSSWDWSTDPVFLI